LPAPKPTQGIAHGSADAGLLLVPLLALLHRRLPQAWVATVDAFQPSRPPPTRTSSTSALFCDLSPLVHSTSSPPPSPFSRSLACRSCPRTVVAVDRGRRCLPWPVSSLVVFLQTS